MFTVVIAAKNRTSLYGEDCACTMIQHVIEGIVSKNKPEGGAVDCHGNNGLLIMPTNRL